MVAIARIAPRETLEELDALVDRAVRESMRGRRELDEACAAILTENAPKLLIEEGQKVPRAAGG